MLFVLVDIIAGHDKNDATSADLEVGCFADACVEDVKGLKIGIPKGYFAEGLDGKVKEAVLDAAKTLEEKGAIIEEFDLGFEEYAIPAYYTIASAENS